MGTGIIVCGLNGAGKSTLGRVLTERLAFRFIDIEDLYFPGTDPGYLYASPRSRAEVETLLLKELRTCEHFVLASVKGDYGAEVQALFRYAVLLDAPKELRMRRVRERSFRKFGGRMQPGGDLYQREEAFFALAASRPEDTAERWLATVPCPAIRLDGTRPAAENAERVAEQLTRGAAGADASRVSSAKNSRFFQGSVLY